MLKSNKNSLQWLCWKWKLKIYFACIYLRQVEGQIEVSVSEGGILLRVQHLQQGSPGVPVDACAKLINLVQQHHRVLHLACRENLWMSHQITAPLYLLLMSYSFVRPPFCGKTPGWSSLKVSLHCSFKVVTQLTFTLLRPWMTLPGMAPM